MFKTVKFISTLLGYGKLKIGFNETDEILEVSPSAITRRLHIGDTVYLDTKGNLSLR